MVELKYAASNISIHKTRMKMKSYALKGTPKQQ